MSKINYYEEFTVVKGADTRTLPKKERTNILKGLPVNIKNYERLPDEHKTDWFNSPISEGTLTDGKYAESAICFDKAWFRFTSGAGRSLVFDLGCECAADCIRVGALKENATGVRFPTRISVMLSQNGENWQTVAEMTGFASEKESDIVRLESTFDKQYKARYLMLTFTVVAHVFIDEIELFGIGDTSAASDIVPDTTLDADFPNRYAGVEQLGAKDVLLAYFCLADKTPITKEIFMPHVAYMKGDEIVDTLFDSFLFLPYVAFLYDKYTKRPLKKSDWQFYIDSQFEKGVNMDALDAAAAEVGEKLGMPDYKVSVFMSILYPVTAVSDFGTVNGRNLDFSKQEDRREALKWFIDEQLALFEAKNYKHITLNGFYWFTEEISYSDEQLLGLIKFTCDYVRSKNLITTWIPYYRASGFNDWRHLGFDMACYQPNYAFNQSVPDSRLFDAASAAKMLGMCIELEIGGTNDWNIERIKKYYAAGAITGYMKEAAHMYYQGGVPGEYYKAYKSEDPVLHSVYDDTYRFIKGTFRADEVDFGEKGEN